MATAFPCPAADLERENRLAEQIVDAILDGEPIQLSTGKHDFLAIETPAETDKAKGAVIILHGRGTHPDWSQVVNPLRVGLPANGWTTLSLQMPVLEKEASYYDYLPVIPEALPRIDAGIKHLHQQGYRYIALIAHSCSVHMSMEWIEQRGTAGIDAYVAIGMGATDYRQPMKKPFAFNRIQVPLLNIYGSEDYPAVLRMADDINARLAEMPPHSAQLRVTGANHYFDDTGEELTTRISAWLDQLPHRDLHH